MPLYLGLDSSTQSLTAVVIEASDVRREVVYETSLNFDDTLPRYGTKHGLLPRADPAIAVSSPVMWAEALELMLTRVVQNVPGMRRLTAIAGSAQQLGCAARIPQSGQDHRLAGAGDAGAAGVANLDGLEHQRRVP